MAGVFNDGELDDGSTLLKSSTHTMLGPCRPPAHNRKLRSESWRVGMTAICPLVSYRPCVTHPFPPLFLPQPLDAFSPRIYSIVCSLTAPVRYLGPSFITSPSSVILPSFLHRLTKEISPSFNLLTSPPTELVDPTSTLCQWLQADFSHPLIVPSVAPTHSAIRSFSSAKARSVLRPSR